MVGENAILIEVAGPAAPGGMDRYGDVADPGAPAPVWQGRKPCVLERKRRRVVSGGNVTPVELDILHVLIAPAALAQAKPGDQAQGHTVVVEDRRVRTAIVTKRFRIVHLEHRAAGTPLDNVRAELADERAP